MVFLLEKIASLKDVRLMLFDGFFRSHLFRSLTTDNHQCHRGIVDDRFQLALKRVGDHLLLGILDASQAERFDENLVSDRNRPKAFPCSSIIELLLLEDIDTYADYVIELLV